MGKLLFTSGSTGMPKAVINTQHMMCANAAMMMQCGRATRMRRSPPISDWMPWNHTMGGNALFNPVLTEGGTLYIDDGRPMPGLIDETLRNLREVSPTYYANVPAGYAALAAAMEKDDALCRSFFKNLRPDGLWRRAAARRSVRPHAGAGGARHRRAHRVLYRLGLDRDRADLDRNLLEHRTRRFDRPAVPRRRTEDGADRRQVRDLRLRGINVTPGYFGRPDLTEAAFDEEGFYCIGDAGVFVDPQDPVQGIIFAGRVVEDFKLTTGTFVHVGSLRTDVIAAATPVVQDALVAGQDRPFVGLLAWPNLHACRQIVGNPDATLRGCHQDIPRCWPA